MNKRDAKQHAINTVLGMLAGRCTPEVDDVEDFTTDPAEQKIVIAEITTILDRLYKQLSRSRKQKQ